MRTHTILTLSVIILSCLLFNTGCNEDNNNPSTTTTIRTSQFAGTQGNCTSGGVKIEVLVDGTVDDAQTQYLCNGAQGQAGSQGQGGTNTTMRTTPFTDAQGGCTNGGIKFEVLVNGVVDDAQTQYICNGSQGGQGQSGTNTTMRSTPFEGAQGSCTNGGVKIEFLVNGVVDDAQTQYICNGTQSEQGEAGCSNGEKSCNGVCTDITTSITNCGACGHDCNDSKPSHAMTMSCLESQCTIATCEDGYILKDGQCVDCSAVTGWAKCSGKCVQTDSDNHNCGVCGKICDEGLTCANGKCVGNTTCSGVQVNTATSIDHCGQCNNRCPDGKTCIDDECKTGYGKAYCGTDIVQIGDIDRCGGCNDRCADGKICKDNKCVNGVGPSYCNGVAINTLIDTSNCGSCGHRCENSICHNGECVDNPGSTYYTDEMYCDGVLIHSLSDSANCNGCGNHCAEGLQCISGICQPLISYTITCNGIAVKPYEDPSNCGKCGNVCGSRYSYSGSCTLGTCQILCNGNITNPQFNSDNCGECGKKCGAGEACRKGICVSGIGEIITFGHYEQDNDTTNGKEPIEWRILDKNDAGQYLVLSEKVLDVKPYPYNTSTSITWEKSTVRSWLNGYPASYNAVGNDYSSNSFIDMAFTATEKAKIVAFPVPAHFNPYTNTLPGNATTDKIFLLSIVEANNYFASNEERQADATNYAIMNGVYVSGSTSNGMCTDVHCYARWCLRSPGSGIDGTAHVYYDGNVDANFDFNSTGGVRPAMWVNY